MCKVMVPGRLVAYRALKPSLCWQDPHHLRCLAMLPSQVVGAVRICLDSQGVLEENGDTESLDVKLELTFMVSVPP
jgi:hypothetical protein